MTFNTRIMAPSVSLTVRAQRRVPLVPGWRRAETGDMIPDVHYAKTSEGVHIAYQVIGEDPIDVVWTGFGYS